MLRLRNVREQLMTVGMRVKWDPNYGEYTVFSSRVDQYHPSAYHTDDLEDAYLTGIRMSREQVKITRTAKNPRIRAWRAA